MPRKEDGTEAAAEAFTAARLGKEEMTVPEPPDRAGLPSPEDMSHPGPVQRELELAPLPGEAEETPAAAAHDEPEPHSPSGEVPSTRDEDAMVPDAGRASDWA